GRNTGARVPRDGIVVEQERPYAGERIRAGRGNRSKLRRGTLRRNAERIRAGALDRIVAGAAAIRCSVRCRSADAVAALSGEDGVAAAGRDRIVAVTGIDAAVAAAVDVVAARRGDDRVAAGAAVDDVV